MQSRSEDQSTQSLEATARQLCKSRDGRWSGSKGMARCPAHDDRTPSLGVTLGRRAILFHCFGLHGWRSVRSDGPPYVILTGIGPGGDSPFPVFKRQQADIRHPNLF